MIGLEVAEKNINFFFDIIRNQSVQEFATFLGICGYSLRDLKGVTNLGKLQETLKKVFPKGLKNLEQESILTDSLMELEEYIKVNSKLDDKVFEKIGKILVNGINREEIMTREYIKILKDLSWIDLEILLYSKNILCEKEEKEYEVAPLNNNRFPYMDLVHRMKKYFDSYPLEIIQISIENLIEKKLLYKQGILINEVELKDKTNGTYIYVRKKFVYSFERELGKKIIELMEE